MLHEFLVANRKEILERVARRIGAHRVATQTATEPAQGLPLFLDQVIDVLRATKHDREDGHHEVSASATRHGGDLQRTGMTVAQVVQGYGSICQSVTELADASDVSITAEEFQVFNGCLDQAIAHAVTEYEVQRDREFDNGPGQTKLAYYVHEVRNILMSSILTFDALARGSVGIHGSTGALLGRSLRRMRALTDRTLTDVRLEAGAQKSERVPIGPLMEELEIIGTIEADEHKVSLSVDPVAPDMSVLADAQILASAVANLVQNALKFSRPGGHVRVKAYAAGDRALIDVADECGGLPPGGLDNQLRRPVDAIPAEKRGLGLGLGISLRGVRSMGGDLRVRDRPGTGCTFTIDLPRAPLLPAS